MPGSAKSGFACLELTVEGSNIAIKVINRKVMINDATVVMADAECSNGVIHVIDSALMPA